MNQNPRNSSGNKLLGRHALPMVPALIWALLATVAWELVGRVLWIQPDILPTPSRILLEWIHESDRLQAHGIITAAEVVGAFLLSLALSIPAAVLVALTPSLRRFLLPMISALRQAPLLAATPLVFIWLGFGVRSIMLLACLLASLTLIPGFVDGLRSVSENMLDLLRLARVGAIPTFIKLRLPSSLPCAFAAMKAAIPLIVTVVAIGEFVDGQKGLAYLMLAASSKLNTSLVCAALAAVLAIGLVLYGAVALAELTLVRYRHP